MRISLLALFASIFATIGASPPPLAAPSVRPAAPPAPDDAPPPAGQSELDLEHAALLAPAYSLLQLGGSLSSRASLEGGQFFELIEDPLLNLLVPVVIQVRDAAPR